jgi:haloacetate dehalogenase
MHIDRRTLLTGTAALLASAGRAARAEEVSMFDGFKSAQVQTSGATINVVSGGKGPPLLLLHGFPQTHVEWHKIAPALAKEFTVVAPDLRGYGDSSKPADGDNHIGYSKRAMAQDQVEVMSHLGFGKFAVVGHDRGGRVAHRMALDHAEKITRIAVIDIVPTHKLYHNVTREFAIAYYHWFFLIQPAPLPETLIGNSLDYFINRAFAPLMPKAVTPEAFAEYLRAFKNPANLHAACEDYRAGASIDLEHDDADLTRKVECPVLALWAERGPMNRQFDVLATWRERATQVTGKSLPGGHFLPEELPDQVLAELQAFLRA